MSSSTVGFIGLGELGSLMAKNLIKHGRDLIVHDVDEHRLGNIVAFGARRADTCRQVAEASDVTIVMVRDDAQLDDVVTGEEGVWQGAKKGSVVVICSTVDPLHCQSLASEGEARGVQVLDAPVSGGWIGAEAGTLTFMVGGEQSAVERCRPLFESMGKHIFHLGGSGMGEVAKLANNYLMSINLATLAEGLALANRAGLDSETFIKVVQVSSGSSWYALNWPLAQEHVRDYCTGKKGALWFAYSKDMGLAIKMAKDIGQLVPLGGLFSQLDPFRFFPGVERSFYDYGPD